MTINFTKKVCDVDQKFSKSFIFVGFYTFNSTKYLTINSTKEYEYKCVLLSFP